MKTEVRKGLRTLYHSARSFLTHFSKMFRGMQMEREGVGEYRVE